MLYEKETYRLRSGLFEVHNEVGVGRSEEAYHQALKLWLQGEDIPFTSKAPHPLLWQGATAIELKPDFVAWDKIVLELKAIPRQFHDEERVQIYDYLKRRNDRLGLMVNMGLDRVHVERIIWDSPPIRVEEKWDYWRDSIQGEPREVGLAVRDLLKEIYAEHGTGYGKEVTTRLIHFALEHSGLSYVVSPICPATYHAREVHRAEADCWIIEDKLLLVFSALFDTNDFNVRRGLSYMKSLNLRWGIAANFGKRVFHITGLRNG
jgi:GxxExxY protein